MKIPLAYIYVIYAFALGTMTLLLVPRAEIRRLAILGIIYGAITDFFMVIIATHLLGIGGYKNFYPFGFMGIPFFPLLAWSSYFIMYLYFLPSEKPWDIIFTLAATGYDIIFSNVLQNLGIFQWNISKLYLPFFIYLFWNLTVTLTFQNYFRDKIFH